MPIIGKRYRHYKSSWGEDFTYEVIALAHHTETSEELVIYKALYYNSSWKEFFARPLSIRKEKVEYKGKVIPRFTII